MAGSDVDQFIESLKAGDGPRGAGYRPFDAGSRVAVARAPGRLDVMGGIADYSGSLVLQRPIAEATCVAVHRHDRPFIEIASTGDRSIALAVDALAPGGEPIAYDSARKVFAPGSDRHWAAYCAGPLLVLMRDRNLQLRGGVRIVIDSRVPEGKGVSSSAAIETASMAALATAFGVTLSDEDLALLCQKAEQLVAGAPCGVMDQMACVFGEPDALMALLCQPAQRLPLVPIPDDIAFWGLDSGERHFVGGSDYTAVRTAAFMGLRIISVHRGLQSAAPTSQSTDYLANITPREFEREFAQHLPVGISGADFLSRYHGTSDNATRVDPARTYHVRPATAHPVYEHDRVTRFRELLLAPPSEQRRREAGGLLYESHASYSACGLGSPGTDRLVELVRSDGAAAGLYGARITGGGSGGTVVVMGRPDAGPSIARVADAYAAQTGHRPYVFSGSSAGVASCGVFDLTI